MCRDFLFGSGREAAADLVLFHLPEARVEALPRGEKIRMLPLYRDWIARGWVSGERYDGVWANVGTPDELRELDVQLAAPPSEKVLR